MYHDATGVLIIQQGCCILSVDTRHLAVTTNKGEVE